MLARMAQSGGSGLIWGAGLAAGWVREGWAALAHAAVGGRVEAVKALLAAGAARDATDAEGHTAVMRAAAEGQAATIAALLVAGANANVAEPTNKDTALMLAASQGHAAAVEALLAGGAKAGLKDVDGDTALSMVRRPPDGVHKPALWLHVWTISTCSHTTRFRPETRLRGGGVLINLPEYTRM